MAFASRLTRSRWRTRPHHARFRMPLPQRYRRRRWWPQFGRPEAPCLAGPPRARCVCKAAITH